jgi:hypothetical protein
MSSSSSYRRKISTLGRVLPLRISWAPCYSPLKRVPQKRVPEERVPQKRVPEKRVPQPQKRLLRL